MIALGLDIGSNSVGSAWIDFDKKDGGITPATSIFPAGVDESDDKRGDPKNAKRRMTRRTRITLARRCARKRELRLKLIEVGLLPSDAAGFKRLLEKSDAWVLRGKALDNPLNPHEFGRLLLHLSQRRGALGLKIADPEDADATDDDGEDGKVKAAIGAVRMKMLETKARTFGEYIAKERAKRVTPITTEDHRPKDKRKGPREFRAAIRNKAASYGHCADRAMIRDEFAKIWTAQRAMKGETAKLLTDELRRALDDETRDGLWRHKGLLFGQRIQSWDLGTLGRCVLEPTERCAPHADMYASRYLVVETINNLKIIERGREPRSLTPDERQKIKAYLSGPLGVIEKGKQKGKAKRTVTITDLRIAMGTSEEGWGRPSKASPFRFNIENDPDRTINTGWFSREIIHQVITPEKWATLPENSREGLNRALLKFDPEQDGDAARLKSTVMMDWLKLTDAQADALVAAWSTRPKPDAKCLKMSRRAVRNLLTIMDRDEPWPDENRPGQTKWVTQIEARKKIADDAEFRDVTTGKPLDEHALRRYETGSKGSTARDRYYMTKHILMKGGNPIIAPEGRPLAEPPPAPLISNPVVRKAIHEVRRHLVEFMLHFGRKPDEVYVELAREARMGKKDADRVLFQNRLRNRIRTDIITEFELGALTSNQQRAAVDRVVLCVQQGGVCPLCGKGGLTERCAARGEECEVAHIIPRASGGHNGLSNIVLAHTKCNREMGRRTPREFWSDGGGFDKGITWIEGIYGNIERLSFVQAKTATGNSLWICYFTKRDDHAKLDQFKKDVKDIQQMTNRQDAATKYAARQIMHYLDDALYGGKGTPSGSTGDDCDDNKRRIFATDGMWTSRFRREWGLFFDPHEFKTKGLTDEEEHIRKEKNRGDHRHHAIDAVVIALCNQHMRNAWEDRERQADIDRVNTADNEQMENYRRLHPIPPPAPFKSRENLRDAVKRAVFGDGDVERPICHRAVKRKLIGAFHEETLFGPVLDNAGQLTGNYTAKKSVLALDPNHLRIPRLETQTEAIERLATRRQRDGKTDEKAARRWARSVVASTGYKPAIIDPPPGKSGIVRDIALRKCIRECLTNAGLDPDNFSANQIKKLVDSTRDTQGGIRQKSGVPIRSVVLLRTMSDPVIVTRKRQDYASGRMLADEDAASQRAYVGGNNHHIEIRTDAKGNWSGEVVSAFEAAQRKLAKLREFRKAGIPKPQDFRKLSEAERRKWRPTLNAIEKAHPVVDRTDNDEKGGAFVMSLCEGEMLCMKHKQTGGHKQPGEVGYFVVAKLDKPRSIVVVPHWDARAATERKDAEGKKVADSKREQFSVTPTDLIALAPPGHPHARKIRVNPLGEVRILERD